MTYFLRHLFCYSPSHPDWLWSPANYQTGTEVPYMYTESTEVPYMYMESTEVPSMYMEEPVMTTHDLFSAANNYVWLCISLPTCVFVEWRRRYVLMGKQESNWHRRCPAPNYIITTLHNPAAVATFKPYTHTHTVGPTK